MMVLLDIVLTQAHMQASLPVMLLCAGVVAGGPVAALLALRVDNAANDSIAVPVCFACHLLWNCIGCLRLMGLRSLDASENSSEPASGDGVPKEAGDLQPADLEWHGAGGNSPLSHSTSVATQAAATAAGAAVTATICSGAVAVGAAAALAAAAKFAAPPRLVAQVPGTSGLAEEIPRRRWDSGTSNSSSSSVQLAASCSVSTGEGTSGLSGASFDTLVSSRSLRSAGGSTVFDAPCSSSAQGHAAAGTPAISAAYWSRPSSVSSCGSTCVGASSVLLGRTSSCSKAPVRGVFDSFAVPAGMPGQVSCGASGLPEAYQAWQKQRWPVLLGSGVVAAAWLVTLCWAIDLAVKGDSDNGVTPTFAAGS